MDNLDALYDAAMAGDANAIAKLETEAERLNEREETILHIESINGNTERVRFILREFAHKNLLVKLDNKKCTALCCAAYEGHTEAVEVLIEAARHLPPSADDNPLSSFQSFLRHADEDLETALYSAVKNGHLAAAKLVAEADPSDRHIQNKYGKTPIYKAADEGYNDIVKVICTTCTPPYNLDGPGGCTALHAAILNDNEDIEVVEVLIGAARLSSSSSDKDDTHTSFQAFLTQGDEDLDTALHIAVMQGRLDTAKLLVEADPTATYIQNRRGETPIYIAAKRGYINIVKMICTTCTPPYNLDGPCGSTALHAAILNGNHDIQVVEVLIGAARLSSSSSDKDDTHTSFQAFLTQGDEYWDTALHIAVMQGRLDTAKLLVEADPTATYIQNEDGETPIYIAAERGYNDIVKLICTTCTPPYNLDGPCGSTALHAAILNGNHDIQVVEVLIGAARLSSYSSDKDDTHTSFQAFLTQGNEFLDTALHIAVMHGRLDTAKLLVEADSTATYIQNKDGKTPIYIAAERGYINIVKMICTTCTPPYNLDGPRGSTALHAAILNGNHDIQVVEVLIGAARLSSSSSDKDDTHTSFQAFLTQGNEFLDTALHIAVMHGRLDTAKLLVEADSTATYIQNKDGKTPIYIAAERGYINIVKMICTTCTPPYNLDGPRGSTALHAAILNGNHDIQVVEVLIGAARLSSSSSDKDDTHTSFQAFLTQGNEFLDTALHIAVMHGRLDTAKLLVEADSTATYIQNKDGKTPIYIAAERGYINIVKMICTTCTPPYNLDGPRGSTALHAAILNGNHDIQVVEVLIGAARLSSSSSDKDDTHTSFQAFLTQGNEFLDTALHIAVMHGRLDTAKLLVEADSTATYIQNKDGKTPIYIAAERGYINIVKMICTTCTPPYNLDGPRGNTVLHAAIKNLHRAEKEDRDVIEIIITKYANTLKDEVANKREREISEDLVGLFNKTDENRCTILELAVERNEVEVVKLILAQNPAYAQRWNRDIISLMPLIYKATDEKYTDIVKLLTQVYNVASRTRGYSTYRVMARLISAIEGRQRERASKILDMDGARTVKFVDNLGWTALHHAAYYEFDSIIDVLVQKQITFGQRFKYGYKVLTPFHVAAGKGYTSTVILLMRLWPSWSSAYTAIDRNEQNILHFAALQSKKEMIQGILKYCSKKYKKKFVNKQDKNGDTPLHMLIRRGCYVPELMKYKGLDTEIKNKEKWTPRALLYFEDQIINDQVQIKIVLDDVESNHKRDISESLVLPSKRQAKDAVFNERMRQDLERYKETHPDQGQWYVDAVNGHAIAKAALEKKANTPNKEEETILHLESKRGDAERVRYIVEEFAKKNLLGKLDRLEQTALHLAAHHGYTEVVKVLIEAARHLPSSSTNYDTHNPVSPFQAFIRQTAGQTGNTALHVAVINGNLATVKLLVKADPSDGHIQNCEGKTPIYIAAEKGYKDIIKVICTRCRALSLEGPGGRTTAFHAAIVNMHKEKEDRDVIRMLINAAKRWSPENAIFEDLFRRTDDSGRTILELAVYRNWVEVVELVLLEGPDNQHGRGSKNNSFMRSIYTAIDKGYNDILKLLTQSYEADITLEDHKRVTDLIVAIKRRDRVSVIRLLGENKQLVTFADEDGGTPLHLAAYDQFDSILDPIIQAQKDVDVGHLFAYSDKDVPTPFHIAAKKGYTLTVIRLMELWPVSSSAYTNVNNDGQNILHLAALESEKEMIKGILKHCPKIYLDQMVNEQDKNGDTPLHLLIKRGCFIPEILKHKGLKTMTKNERDQTPLDYFYLEEEIIADQVQIKIALDDVESNHKRDISERVQPSKQHAKDALFKERMRQDLERYKETHAEDQWYADAVNGHAIAKVALEMKADTLNKEEETILHLESKRGDAEHVRYIVEEFANKNLLGKLDRLKQTALHLAAAHHRHTKVVKVLIEAAQHLPSSSTNDDDTHNPVGPFQAFIRQATGMGNTALHVAVINGNVATVKLLVEADTSDGHIQNCEGKTPIYIAAEKGYKDIIKVICTSRTALSLEGPGGRTTAFHAAIVNMHKEKEDNDVIRMLINAAKCWSPENAIFEDLFRRTDDSGRTILELAVYRNWVEVVELVLLEGPDNQHGRGSKNNSFMRSIYTAIDKGYNDILKLLTQSYEADITLEDHKRVTDLIVAIKRRDRVSVIRLLGENKQLVTFADEDGWTPLHLAAYDQFDSILHPIIQAQKDVDVGHLFAYSDKDVPTPFHIAAEKGYTSTVIRLMELWPASSSAYTHVNNDGQNILHLAALESKKEMIKGILKHCSEEYKNEFVNKQDKNGDTPLHMLIQRGCFVPELMKYKGLDTEIKNKEEWTPRDLLYFEDQIINDQVQIKIVLDDVESNHKREISERLVLPSKRQAKDVVFNERMRQDLEMYKETHATEGQWYADAVTGHAIAKAALEKKADTPNKEEETILHLESKRGDAERVRYIVEEFANKNLLGKLDRLKQTALHLAAHHGHTEVVEVLIEAARHLPSSSTNYDTHNPVSPFQAFIRQAAGPTGNTALHVAVIYGKVATVKLLVEADPSDGHIQNCEGKTPIYIAAENGYIDIIKAICTSCVALSLEGPGGGTTAFHALLKNIRQVTEKERDVIGMMINAARRWSAEDASHVSFEALCERTDESGSTILQLAVERNYVDAVELILLEDPGRGNKKHSLMRLIYKAIDEQLSKDIVKLLSQAYEAGINSDHKGVVALILAIKAGEQEESIQRLLRDAKRLVSFSDDEGWTPLHYATYHELVSIFETIIEVQKDVGHQFVYGDKVSTPLHVAAENGFTSTLIRLMELWPASSSVYTAVNKTGQNILHVAAAENRKEMVQGILEYCPEKYKESIFKQKDASGNTPLHLLISHGCFIPELIKHKGLTTAKNNDNYTPRDMLYCKDEIVADQVQIKIALDDVQTNKSAWKCWGKSMKKKTVIWDSAVPLSKRDRKDVTFDAGKKRLMDEKYKQMKKDLEKYKSRTNTQILVTALITTVTFTVGFTMPGGLRQSGGKDEGLAVLSKKKVFNAFMVSDALALLLSTSSLFFYFLESMNEDPYQVAKLNAASTVLNIVSVMAMMLTFITGTYVVLSDSPALAITVCIIGSLFFLLIITILLIKIVYDRQVKKRNKD